MAKHVIGNVADLPIGERMIVTLEGRSIGVFNVHGTYYALRDSCPHQGAPLCKGATSGLMFPSKPGEYIYGREGEIVRCPWHGWEFDITNGQSIFNPHKCRVKSYEVTIENNPELSAGQDDQDPEVETYDVTVESGSIVVHV